MDPTYLKILPIGSLDVRLAFMTLGLHPSALTDKKTGQKHT